MHKSIFSLFGYILYFSILQSAYCGVDIQQLKAAYIKKLLPYIKFSSIEDDQFRIYSSKESKVTEYLKVNKSNQYKILDLTPDLNLREVAVFFDCNLDYSEFTNMTEIMSQPNITISGCESNDMNYLISFILFNGKLKFNINNTHAKKHGITISSQLLKLAKEIK